MTASAEKDSRREAGSCSGRSEDSPAEIRTFDRSIYSNRSSDDDFGISGAEVSTFHTSRIQYFTCQLQKNTKNKKETGSSLT